MDGDSGTGARPKAILLINQLIKLCLHDFCKKPVSREAWGESMVVLDMTFMPKALSSQVKASALLYSRVEQCSGKNNSDN